VAGPVDAERQQKKGRMTEQSLRGTAGPLAGMSGTIHLSRIGEHVALQVQAEELRVLLHSADHLAAVTAFLEKRAPVFTRS
jgi:hypothetical protein